MKALRVIEAKIKRLHCTTIIIFSPFARVGVCFWITPNNTKGLLLNCCSGHSCYYSVEQKWCLESNWA